jgi:hypothetical protein
VRLDVGQMHDGRAPVHRTAHEELHDLPVRHRVREEVALAEAGVVLRARLSLREPRADARVAKPEAITKSVMRLIEYRSRTFRRLKAHSLHAI